MYDLKIFKDKSVLRKLENNPYLFKGRQQRFLSDKNPPVDLPNPREIAIHATITGVVVPEIFLMSSWTNTRDDEENVPAVRSWAELEILMEEQLGREYIIKAFQSVKAC